MMEKNLRLNIIGDDSHLKVVEIIIHINNYLMDASLFG